MVYGPYREFAFPCPECAVEIRFGVEVILPTEKDLKNWVESTKLPAETFVPEAEYTKPINAQWINRHASKAEWAREDENIENVEILDDTFLVAVPKQRHFPPFILAQNLMGDAIEEFQTRNSIRRKAASELWPALEQLIMHYTRKQWVLFDKQFRNLFDANPPVAIADKSQILYQQLEQYGLLFSKNHLSQKLVKQRLNEAETISRPQVRSLIDYYQSTKKDIAIEKQLNDIRRRWAQLFSALAALYTTHYWDVSAHKITDFTLAQKRFGELKSLYVDSFETFCRVSVIAAVVEGIILLGRAVVPKARGEFTVEEFDIFKNGSKSDILRRLGSPVADLFVPYIDHRLRNGIGHNSATYDVVLDEVHYVTENERGVTNYNISYISFCESLFNLYLQLEVVALYVNWVRLFYKPKDGGRFLLSSS